MAPVSFPTNRFAGPPFYITSVVLSHSCREYRSTEIQIRNTLKSSVCRANVWHSLTYTITSHKICVLWFKSVPKLAFLAPLLHWLSPRDRKPNNIFWNPFNSCVSQHSTTTSLKAEYFPISHNLHVITQP